MAERETVQGPNGKCWLGKALSTMNSRQRVEAALNHVEPDRTPIFEYVLLSPRADELLGRPYVADATNWPACIDELGWQEAVRQSAIDMLDLACLLGHDMLHATPNRPRHPNSVPQPLGSISDPVRAVQKRNEARAQEAPGLPDERLLVYVFLKEEMERRGVDLPILAPAAFHGVWTNTDLMETMVLAPEVAHEHFSLATRDALALIERYIALGIDHIGIGGDFAGNRPLISPECYREFVVPEVRKLSRRIHEANLWALNGSDGNLWPVIDDFLLGCEVDGYFEIDMHAGMDLRHLKADYGDRITFYGNLDCGNILSFGTPADVRRHTIECIEAGWGKGGHILTASNAITSSVPIGNYLAIVYAYRDMFGLEPPRLTEATDRGDIFL